MNRKSALSPMSMYIRISASFLAGLTPAIFVNYFSAARSGGIMATGIAFILLTAGLCLGIYSICISNGRKRILIPAVAVVLLNLGSAWFTYEVLSKGGTGNLFRIPFGENKAAGRNLSATRPKIAGKIRSVYTSLKEEKCKLIDTSDEGGYSLQSCPGINGYKLLVEDFDARMSVTVVDPGDKEHPLEFIQFVTQHFCELGEKAEWRVAKVDGRETPIALMVRVYSQSVDYPFKFTPYLAVAKVTPDEICVTDRIGPGPEQNEKARQAADRAIYKDCMDAVSD